MIETFNNDSCQWAIGKVVEIVESVKLNRNKTENYWNFNSFCPIETSLLICKENQLAGFYMIGTFVMKELNKGMFVICFKKGGLSDQNDFQ